MLFEVSFQFFSLRSSSSRPSFAFFACSSRINALMRCRAFVVTTKLSQSAFGCWFFCDIISTISPFLSCSRIGTALPFTLPPEQVEPRFVWMSKAKSRTVAPSGSLRISPFGVKINISPEAGLASKRSAMSSFVSSISSRNRCSHCSDVCAP